MKSLSCLQAFRGQTFKWESTITGLDHWTGPLDWTTGLDYWTGLLDWTTGLDYWTGPLDWTTGLDYWTGPLDWTTGLDHWTGLLDSPLTSKKHSFQTAGVWEP